MGYKKDAINGVSWLGSFRVITRGMSFIRTAILARVLSPVDFGLFGIASLTLSLIEIFTETGINIFLIQQKDKFDEYINTAWIISITRGTIISVLLYFTSYWIGQFFDANDAVMLLQIISIVPFIRGFINPSITKFIKNLEFHREFYYRTTIFFVESLATLIIVIFLPNSISLVLGLIFGAIFEVILSFLLAKPLPLFTFNKIHVKKILLYGKWLTLGGMFEYLFQNVDTIIVGKFLGTAHLGLYNMAYKISSVPITEFSDVFSRATFPVYVKISNDRSRLLKAFHKSLIITILCVLPIGLIFLLFPKIIIATLLGDQWISAAPTLQILALFGSLRAILNIAKGLFYSINRQDIVTKVTFVSLLFLLISVVPLVTAYGIKGAAISAFIGTIASYPVMCYFLYKIFYKKTKV